MNADALPRCPFVASSNEGVGEDELQVASVRSSSDPSEAYVSDLIKKLLIANVATSFANEQQKDEKWTGLIRYLSKKELPQDHEKVRQLVLQSHLYTLHAPPEKVFLNFLC